MEKINSNVTTGNIANLWSSTFQEYGYVEELLCLKAQNSEEELGSKPI